MNKSYLKDFIKAGGNASLAGRLIGSISEGHARKLFKDWTPETAKEFINAHEPHGSEVILPLTDWHYGEVIKPCIQNNHNTYNTSVAKDRLEILFSELKTFLNPWDTKLHIICMGDHISGQLHDEHKTDDELSPLAANNEFSKLAIKHIKSLLTDFRDLDIIINGVSSNHARQTHKVRSKNALEYSYDRQLEENLRFAFETDPRVTINEFEDDILVNIANMNWAFSHGHLGKGSSSTSSVKGMSIQALIGLEQSFVEVGIKVDMSVIGHFHSFNRFEDNMWTLPSPTGANEYEVKQLRVKSKPPRAVIWRCDDGELIDDWLIRLN